MWTNNSMTTSQPLERKSAKSKDSSLNDVPSTVTLKLRNGSNMTPMSKGDRHLLVTPMKSQQLRTPSTVASTPSSEFCPSSEPSCAPTITPLTGSSYFRENHTVSCSSRKNDQSSTSRSAIMRNAYKSGGCDSEMEVDCNYGQTKRTIFEMDDESTVTIPNSLLAPPSPQYETPNKSWTQTHLKPQPRSSSLDSSSFMSKIASNTTRQRQKSLRRTDSANYNFISSGRDHSPPVRNNEHSKSNPIQSAFPSSSFSFSQSIRSSSNWFTSSSKGLTKRSGYKTSIFPLKIGKLKMLPVFISLLCAVLAGLSLNLFMLGQDNVDNVSSFSKADTKLRSSAVHLERKQIQVQLEQSQHVPLRNAASLLNTATKKIESEVKSQHSDANDEPNMETKEKAKGKKKKSAKALPFRSHRKQTDDEKENLYSRDDDKHMYSSTGKTNTKKTHPRIFNMGSSSHNKFEKPKPRRIQEYPAEFSDNTQFYSVLPSDDTRLGKMEIREPLASGECVPMQEWQTSFNPVCNGMHELDLVRMEDPDQHGSLQLVGKKGFWRNAWKVDVLGGKQTLEERESIVLKTLRYNHNFEDAHFEHDRIDAIAMERLTASPHVINIYGFCGHSVLTEYASNARLGSLADKSKKKPLKRLEIARDIASGLADVHGIDGDGNSTFVHLDINPANVVVVGNQLKLNDFNIGILQRWNTTSNKQCRFPAQYPNPQWRSPEEANESQFLTEKVDVFSLGHIFFRLICGHEPWNKLEIGGKPHKAEMTEKVKAGILPRIPDEVMNSENEEVIAIRDAMLACYTFDPEKRPSARQITNELNDALAHLKQKMDKKKGAKKGNQKGKKDKKKLLVS